MKRLLQWITGIILMLVSSSQILELIGSTHTWYYKIFFIILYIIAFALGASLFEKSLK